jgi:hypothetical protein
MIYLLIVAGGLLVLLALFGLLAFCMAAGETEAITAASGNPGRGRPQETEAKPDRRVANS